MRATRDNVHNSAGRSKGIAFAVVRKFSRRRSCWYYGFLVNAMDWKHRASLGVTPFWLFPCQIIKYPPGT